MVTYITCLHRIFALRACFFYFAPNIKGEIIFMWRKRVVQLVLATIVLVLATYLFRQADRYTSTDAYCNSCHVHDHAHQSWQQSIHHNNKWKKKVQCVKCHLPPRGEGYYWQKAKTGVRDIYAYYFKDSSTYRWDQKQLPEHAAHHTYKASCTKCHPKLFPIKLSQNGELAHWHYVQNQDHLHCVHCHINVGHGAIAKAGHNLSLLEKKNLNDTIYTSASTIRSFEDYNETIPQTNIAFKMIAVPGGKLQKAMGDKENTSVDSFFMARIEVTWEAYLQFLRETESEGRTESEVDGISGATPPWGNPDQGWGMGKRPAITMTHHAARVYCRWLTERTGKEYRLPTEHEWDYVASKSYGSKKEVARLSNFNGDRTVEPSDEQEDDQGFINLFGNVHEFCSNTFSDKSKEHVIKGGSFKTDISKVTPWYREATQHDNWLKTDPQIPKSIWWYSDCYDVGFRVVLSYKKEGND
jgi:nitrate/TMAO reductase-like tetraheme cytochrome c subunit